MKTHILLLLLLTLNTWASTQIMANSELQKAGKDVANINHKAQDLGINFKIRNNTYQLIQNGYAQKDNNNTTTVSSIELIEKKGPYNLFIDHTLSADTLINLHSEKKFYIARNKRTNDIAILTGKLIVTFSDLSQVQAIAQTYGLTISTRFDLINTVFYTVSSHDLFATAQQLRAETTINTVEIDMIEHLRYPN